MKKWLEEGVGTRFIASAPMTCRWGAEGWSNEARHGRPLDASPPALRSACLLANNFFMYPTKGVLHPYTCILAHILQDKAMRTHMSEKSF